MNKQKQVQKPRSNIIINPTKILQNSSLDYAPKGSILVGQGETEKCKFVELSGNAKLDENGNFILVYNSENNTLDDTTNIPKDIYEVDNQEDINSNIICTKGDKGDTGEKGDKGDTGEKGDKGDSGTIGPKGSKGDSGEKGDKGDSGTIGPKGSKGDKGDKGDTGDQGMIGIKGVKGDQGEKANKVFKV